MFSEYIQAPYVKTPFGLATPALIISIAYLLILGIYLIIAKKKGYLKISLVNFSKLIKGDKNKIIFSTVGYFVFIFSCIILPRFLGKDNLVLKISKTYLSFETLIFILLISFLCISFLNKINRETHIKASNSIFQYLIWISLGTGILWGQIDYAYWKNILVIVSAWILNGLFFIVDIIPKQKNIEDDTTRFDLIPYGAVNKADELFPLHKEQANSIANIIHCSSAEPFSICLTGTWGTGKTSVINGVIDILKNNEEKPYDVIYINALELDDKKSMLNYLMTQIRENLKSRGVYVGFNSEYKEFISSITGTLTSSSIGALLQKKFLKDEDYRRQKLNLEKVLERTYNNGKLIVVVDDIERCDKNIAREYLFLIKEVATMRNCVSVFVTDYNMLNKVLSSEEAAENSMDFLNKFFNHKIELLEEEPSDILGFYDRFFKIEDKAFWSIYKIICKSPGTWYNETITGLTAKINDLENDSKRLHLFEENQKVLQTKVIEQKECLALFIRLMQTPRNIAKFYNVFRNHALYCEKNLFFSSENENVKKYINSRNIGQILYLISFIEVMLPTEYHQLKIQGAQYIDPPFDEINNIPNVNRRLLVELTKGLVFGEYFEYKKPNGYIKSDIRKFIETFLTKKTELYQLVNPFTSQEEKWINAINELNYQIIEEYWEEIVLMVFQKVPNEKMGINDIWRKEKLLFLLEFAEEQVKTGIWNSDKIFSLFNSNLHFDRYWSLGKGLMQTFWKHISESNVYTKPSNDSAQKFNVFISHYAYARISTMYRLAHYLIPLNNDNVKTDNIQEYLLDSNKTFVKNISRFLNKFEEIIPNFSYTNEEWYNNFEELANAVNDYLVSKGIADYLDIKDDIENMFDSLEEFKGLQNIIEWVGLDGSDISKDFVSQFELDNIDEMIEYFNKQIGEQSSQTNPQRDIEREFSNFFIKLRDAEGISLTKDQLQSLHSLVEKFVEQFAISSLPYRRTLLSIPEKE